MTSRLRFHRTALRLIISWGFLAGLCLACTYEEGERATTGACPEGETCAETTPEGLRFYGAFLSDDPTTTLTPRLAAGGSQNMHWGATEDGTRPVGAVAESSASWFLEIDGADADRDTFALWTGADDIRVTAAGEGEAHLRVLDPDTGELYDRLLVTSERIATIEVLDRDTDLPAEELVRGTRASLVFQLLGDTDMRLIDEGMTIASETPFERSNWDAVEVEVPADAEQIHFTLEAGHRRWGLDIPVSE